MAAGGGLGSLVTLSNAVRATAAPSTANRPSMSRLISAETFVSEQTARTARGGARAGNSGWSWPRTIPRRSSAALELPVASHSAS